MSKIITNVEKNSQILRCYNLVFRKVTIKENVGSILSNIYLIGYLISFGIFCYKRASYLKIEIEKLMQKEENIKENTKENNTDVLNNDNMPIYLDNIDKEKIEQKIKDKDEINIYNKKEIKIEKENEKNNGVEIIKINNTKIKNLKIETKEYSEYLNNFMGAEKNLKTKKKINKSIIINNSILN